MMNRRKFINAAGLGLLASFAARAQRGPYRIGFLASRSAEDNNVKEFRKALHELGFREPQNLHIEFRWAGGNPEHFRKFAAELVALKVDAIVAITTPGALAARSATSAIPIVFIAVGDPVGAGVVSNLAHPGANVTGLTHMSVDLAAKTVELLKEAVPGVTRIAVLAPLQNPTTALKLRGTQTAARLLGVKLRVLDVRTASDFANAFQEIRNEKPEALITLLDTLTVAHRKEIADFALTNRLPTIYELPEFVEAGGLMSYGADFPLMYRRAATYVDRILKGAKPGELPVEQPTNFELVINLRTADVLGLGLPQPLVLRANHVIR